MPVVGHHGDRFTDTETAWSTTMIDALSVVWPLINRRRWAELSVHLTQSHAWASRNKPLSITYLAVCSSVTLKSASNATANAPKNYFRASFGVWSFHKRNTCRRIQQFILLMRREIVPSTLLHPVRLVCTDSFASLARILDNPRRAINNVRSTWA